MDNVSKEGRTILFVSHNMASIARICSSTLWIQNGEFKKFDYTQSVISTYLNSIQLHGAELDNRKLKIVKDTPEFELEYMKLFDSNLNITSEIDVTKDFFVEVLYTIKEKVSPVRISIRLISNEGSIILLTHDLENTENRELKNNPGKYKSVCRMPGGLLNEGNFGIALSVDIPFEKVIFYYDTLINFSAHRLEKDQLERREKSEGLIKTDIDWEIQRI